MHPRIPLESGRCAALAAGVFLAFSGAASGRECWMDIYDKANFQGAHQRIEGPAQIPSLSKLGGQDWSNRIESVRIGADAEATAFRQEDFKEEPEGPVNHPEAFAGWGKQEIAAYQELEISFGPGKEEHHLGELDFHRNINSLVVRCKK